MLVRGEAFLIIIIIFVVVAEIVYILSSPHTCLWTEIRSDPANRKFIPDRLVVDISPYARFCMLVYSTITSKLAAELDFSELIAWTVEFSKDR